MLIFFVSNWKKQLIGKFHLKYTSGKKGNIVTLVTVKEQFAKLSKLNAKDSFLLRSKGK